ncbi:MAG: dTMP kinase [Alphaproteobacteria bacterium]
MKNGWFITFEGGEGGGKSTQAGLLATALRDTPHEVVLTREPGGADGAELIREILINGPPDRWSPTAEALLFFAARDEHLRQTIRPALKRGAIVICDRYIDSTRAYQGVVGKLGAKAIQNLEDLVVGDCIPDLTLVLDLPFQEGIDRTIARGKSEDRFERKAAQFHEKLRATFLTIAIRDPGRCVVVDASQPIDTIAAVILNEVNARLPGIFAARRNSAHRHRAGLRNG